MTTLKNYKGAGKFSTSQIQILREGLKHNVDISICAKPEFDSLQMKVIIKGLVSKVDVTKYANPKISSSGMREILKGLLHKIDVSIYADPVYNWRQMEQIRLGLQNGVDVSIYAKPEFDGDQMAQIRLGLQNGVDVSIYANPKFGELQMKEIKQGLINGIDVGSYTSPCYNWKEMRAFRLAIEKGQFHNMIDIWKGVSMEKYVNDGFDQYQLSQIYLGLKSSLDVSLYARHDFNWLQMQEIRLGIQDNVNISYYNNPSFDERQMMQIRLGLLHGLNVSIYAKPGINWRCMELIRGELSKLPLKSDHFNYVVLPEHCQIIYQFQDELSTNELTDGLYIHHHKQLDIKNIYQICYNEMVQRIAFYLRFSLDKTLNRAGLRWINDAILHIVETLSGELPLLHEQFQKNEQFICDVIEAKYYADSEYRHLTHSNVNYTISLVSNCIGGDYSYPFTISR